jgi:hypothetical protein
VREGPAFAGRLRATASTYQSFLGAQTKKFTRGAHERSRATRATKVSTPLKAHRRGAPGVGGHRGKVAALLAIDPKALYWKILGYAITPEEWT